MTILFCLQKSKEIKISYRSPTMGRIVILNKEGEYNGIFICDR